MRFMLYLANALVFITGVQLFILTEQTDRYFAWTIQPPATARAIGPGRSGWVVAVVQTLRERDLTRVRPATASYIAFGALELLAVARYSGDIDWARPSAAIYMVFMATVLLAGIGGWLTARRSGS